MLPPKIKPYWLQITLALLLLVDLGYSTIQHHHKALDGDMVSIALPAIHYTEVLNDPMGITALTENKQYSGAGRFWAHFTEHKYYHTVPQLLQSFLSPIESVYTASALLKILMQAMLIGMLAGIISGTNKFWSKDYLIAAFLVTPFFVTAGHYYKYLAIIDNATTYAIAYALVIAVLLLYFYPFLKAVVHGRPFKVAWWQVPLLATLACTVTFSGPLVQPVVILLTITAVLTYVFYYLRQPNNKLSLKGLFTSVPWQVVIFLGTISLISLYAYYVGTYNLENQNSELVDIWTRYGFMLQGLAEMFDPFTGYTAVWLFVFINWYLMYKQRQHKYAKTILVAFNVVFIFIVLYLLLLPWGGYRSYRPFIVRRDTLIPANLGLIFLYGSSTLFLLKHYSGRAWKIYLGVILVFTWHLVQLDHLSKHQYYCERDAIETIANAQNSPVLVSNKCPVLEWGLITEPNISINNGKMLKVWNITETEMQYYQEP